VTNAVQGAVRKAVQAGVTYVVAVSGGVDSMALLHALLEVRRTVPMELVVAHVNYGLRGAESDADEARVRAFAEAHGVRVVCARADAAALAAGNLQHVARELRYGLFRDVVAEVGAAGVMLGHHADDQAETLLLRLLRGAGLRGTRGMVHDAVVDGVLRMRPFLGIRKQTLRDYCAQHAVPWGEDGSNETDAYTRNHLRHHVAPQLAALQPNWVEALQRHAAIAAEEDAWMHAETAAAFARLVQRNHHVFTLARDAFIALPIALQRRLITLVLNQLRVRTETINFDQVELIRTCAIATDRQNLHIDLADGYSFTREYDVLRFAHEKPALHPQGYTYTIDATERELTLPNGDTLQVSTTSFSDEQTGADVVTFDRDMVQWPLVVRTRQTGDRIQLAGMQGRKSLKKWLIEQRWSVRRRNQTPVICDASNEPLWMPGLRPSVKAQVHAHTTSLLHIRYTPFIQ
jgi:tRNA(Ile)-lysidine synthase